MDTQTIFSWLSSHPLIDFEELELTLDFPPDLILKSLNSWQVSEKQKLSDEQLILIAEVLKPYGFIPAEDIIGKEK